jgi:hypothetical protein
MMKPKERQEAEAVVAAAEESVAQLNRVLRRLEAYTDYLNVLALEHGDADATDGR